MCLSAETYNKDSKNDFSENVKISSDVTHVLKLLFYVDFNKFIGLLDLRVNKHVKITLNYSKVSNFSALRFVQKYQLKIHYIILKNLTLKLWNM